MGADIVLNHKEDLVRQFKEQNIPLVDYIYFAPIIQTCITILCLN